MVLQLQSPPQQGTLYLGVLFRRKAQSRQKGRAGCGFRTGTVSQQQGSQHQSRKHNGAPGRSGPAKAQSPEQGGGGGVSPPGVEGSAAPGDAPQSGAAGQPGQNLQTAAEHEAQQHAHRVDVRALVRLPVAELFRRSRGFGTQQHRVPALLRQVTPGGAHIYYVTAEISVYHYVLRLDVPVYNWRVLTVEIGQHPAERLGRSPGLSRTERPPALHQILEAQTRHIFPHQILSALLKKIGQGPGQLGMVQGAQQLIFPAQGILPAERLDLYDCAPARLVPGQVDAAPPFLQTGEYSVLGAETVGQAYLRQDAAAISFKEILSVAHVSYPSRRDCAPAEKSAAPPSLPG